MQIVKDAVMDAIDLDIPNVSSESVDVLVESLCHVNDLKLALESDDLNTAITTLHNELLLSMKIPHGISVESMNVKTLRGILATSLEETEEEVKTIKEAFKKYSNSMKVELTNVYDKLKELSVKEMVDINAANHTTSLFNGYTGLIAAGFNKTDSMLKYIMTNRISELLQSHVDLVEFITTPEFRDMDDKEANKEVAAILSKVKVYKKVADALANNVYTYARDTQAIKDHHTSIKGGNVEVSILKPYPGANILVSAGQHDKSTSPIMSSQVHIKDDKLVCDTTALSDKDVGSFIKYSMSEVKELFNIFKDTSKFVDRLGTKEFKVSSHTSDYIKSFIKANMHMMTYANEHLKIVHAMRSDMKGSL